MINHISVVSRNPKASAEALAKLTGGDSGPFPPLSGGQVCFLDKKGWSGNFIEFYPIGQRLICGPNGTKFEKFSSDGEYVNATHINLSVKKTQKEIAFVAEELGLRHGWR